MLVTDWTLSRRIACLPRFPMSHTLHYLYSMYFMTIYGASTLHSQGDDFSQWFMTLPSVTATIFLQIWVSHGPKGKAGRRRVVPKGRNSHASFFLHAIGFCCCHQSPFFVPSFFIWYSQNVAKFDWLLSFLSIFSSVPVEFPY